MFAIETIADKTTMLSPYKLHYNYNFEEKIPIREYGYFWWIWIIEMTVWF